jgi:glycosyltransferase involved in cell wall biosynthesis
MKVLVTSECRFVDVGGTLYTSALTPTFFQRYLDVWDEVLLLARVSSAKQPPLGVLPMDFRQVRLIGLPDFKGALQYMRCLPRIRKIARQALEETDSVVFRVAGVIGTAVWPLVQSRGQPFGAEVCGDPGTTRGSLRHPLRPFFHWYFTRDLRRMCQAASASAYVTAQTLQSRYPPAVGAYTTNYSSIELPNSRILNASRADFLTSGARRLVCVGTFTIMYKGQDVLLQALAQLVRQGCDATLTFVGDGRFRTDMEKLAHELGLDERVIFRGNLPAGDAVLAELDQADLFVLPSRQEGLPRVVIEAMARGLPCVGSRVGGIPELIGPDELVPPDNPTALANKITELLGDPERMERLSERNLQIATGFTSEVLRARRLAFYEHLRNLTESWQRDHRRNDVPISADVNPAAQRH